MKLRLSCVYIITNEHNTVLYTGVSADLVQRIIDHRNKIFKGSFSDRYNLYKLVYYECFMSISEAIKREKQVKKYSRKKKIALIVKENPGWNDLFEEIEA